MLLFTVVDPALNMKLLSNYLFSRRTCYGMDEPPFTELSQSYWTQGHSREHTVTFRNVSCKNKVNAVSVGQHTKTQILSKKS